MQPKILENKLEGKGDVLFYDGLVIATWDNGETYLSLEANGEVDIVVDGAERYTNRDIEGLIKKYNLDDKILREMCDAERIVWDSNGWFEIMIGYKQKNGVVVFSDCTGDAWHDYDDAMGGFLDSIKDFDKPLTWLGKKADEI